MQVRIAQQQCPYGSSSHSVCSIEGRHPCPSGKQLCATPSNSSAPTVVIYCKPMEPRSNATTAAVLTCTVRLLLLQRFVPKQHSHVPIAALLYQQFVLQSCRTHANSATWRPSNSQQRSAGSSWSSCPARFNPAAVLWLKIWKQVYDIGLNMLCILHDDKSMVVFP